MLNKIPKIHIIIFKTVDARASGLHFTTSSSAWRWPWRWYQKLPKTAFYRANMLNKIPKIHIKSFKTVEARASWLHFTTPFWAWRWYQKLPIITFWGKQEIYNISKNQLSRHYGVLSRAQKPTFRPLFGVPWAPKRAYPRFYLTTLFLYVLLMSYPKIIFLGLVVPEK